MADDKTTTSSDLFRVCDGLPVIEGLIQAQCYLAAAHDVAVETAMGKQEDCKAWGAVYLIRAAKALVDSVAAKVEAESISKMAAEETT